MKIKKLIVLFVSFTLCTVSAGDVVSFDSGVCKFSLHDYELAPQVQRAIVFGVSRIVDTYGETFGFSYPKDFKVKITIFSKKEEFLQYQKGQIGTIISESGYFTLAYRETVVLNEKNTTKTKDEKEMVGVVFHEANHLILTYHIPWCPTWVNEGLSEYFEGFNVFGENKRVYLQENRQHWCKHWAEKGFPINLKDYLSLNHDQWMAFMKKDPNAAYTIGYSLVYFMMSRISTENVLKELLWEFKREGKDTNSIEVIDRYYPGGFEKFERSWKEWIPKARPYRPLRALRTQAQTTDSKPPVNVADEKNSPNEK
jgi:hypothetical protein